MSPYEIFKEEFAKFDAAFFGLTLEYFQMRESKRVFAPQLVERYEVKFSSEKRELVLSGTAKHMLCSVKDARDKGSFSLQDYLKNRKRPEIDARPDEDARAFLKRAREDIEHIFKTELAEVLKGNLWIDEPINYEPYR